MFLFGCKDTTLHVAKFLKRRGLSIHLVTIAPALAARNDVAGYVDLTLFPEIFSSIYSAESYNLRAEKDVEFFGSGSEFGLGFCVGWQRLIPSHVLKKFPKGIHGMHGSARDLPYGKGRSPMNWALIEGRKFFFTNLFRYLDGVDNGPIVDAAVFSIQDSDTAETMHFKNVLGMCDIIERNLDALLRSEVKYREQEAGAESFYPKREPADGVIDWRDDITNIERLVRAVAPPFYGAVAFHGSDEFQIHRAAIFYTDLENHPFVNAEYGEVVDIFPNGKFLVRCSGGVLIVHEFSKVELRIGDILTVQNSPFGRFSRNAYGFFDI